MREKQEEASFARSFVRGELHLGFWSFVKKGAGALDSVIVLSALSVHEFGVYQLLLSFYGALSTIFQGVFSAVAGNDLARFLGEGAEAKAKRLFFEYAGFRIAMALIPAAALWIGAPIAGLRYGAPAALWMRLLSVLFCVEVLLQLILMPLKMRLQFSVLAPRATLQKVLQFAILFSFYSFSAVGVREILLAQIGATAGVIFYALPAAIRAYGPWRRISAHAEGILAGTIRRYGMWALPQAFLTDFIAHVRPWLIKIFVGTEAVGIFGVANTFISLLKDVMPIRTLDALVPRAAHDPARTRALVTYGAKYYVLLAAGLAAAGAVGAPLAVYLLFPKFIPSLRLFYIMLPVIPVFAFIKMTNMLLVARRRQRFIFAYAAAQNAFSAGLLALLLPVAGIAGAAYAELLSQTVGSSGKYFYLARSKFIARFPWHTFVRFDEYDRRAYARLRRLLIASFRMTRYDAPR